MHFISKGEKAASQQPRLLPLCKYVVNSDMPLNPVFVANKTEKSFIFPFIVDMFAQIPENATAKLMFC